jgi:hypothetical protein
MGHERIGLLPKSKKWRDIVNLLSDFQGDPESVKEIAARTLSNVQKKLSELQDDKGFNEAFKFLVAAAGSFSSAKLLNLESLNIALPDNPSPISFAIALKRWLPSNTLSEIGAIAQEAAVDALAGFYRQHMPVSTDLFGTIPAEKCWKEMSTAGGFSELARLFFSNYTNRYLNYFLDREAAHSFGSLTKRLDFSEQVNRHAFETAKITQSFAAGWYAKQLKNNKFPSNQSIKEFLRVSSSKLFEEIKREANK